MGIPQGSVLGPLLFVTCIHDLPHVFNKAVLYMFSDDNNLFFAGDIEQGTMQDETKNIYNWLCCDKLSLNWTKTELVSFNKTNIKELSINDHTFF